MSRQRWGSFSVRDHIEPYAFITEVFLYDRLIVPYPADDEERKRWEENRWAPGRLDEYLKVLGKEAVTVPWTRTSMTELKNRYELAHMVALDKDPFAATRHILPAGIKIPADAWAVAAYPSKDQFSQDFMLADSQLPEKLESEDREVRQIRLEELCWLLGHSFLVPHGEVRNDFYLLKEAKELAATDEFIAYRTALYEWQDNMIENNISDADALQGMQTLLQKYNDFVEKKCKNKRRKFIFTVVAPGIMGMSTPLFPPALAVAIGAAGLFLASYSFRKFDEEPVMPDRYKPAAMFHDIYTHFGWSIKAEERKRPRWWEKFFRHR